MRKVYQVHQRNQPRALLAIPSRPPPRLVRTKVLLIGTRPLSLLPLALRSIPLVSLLSTYCWTPRRRRPLYVTFGLVPVRGPLPSHRHRCSSSRDLSRAPREGRECYRSGEHLRVITRCDSEVAVIGFPTPDSSYPGAFAMTHVTYSGRNSFRMEERPTRFEILNPT